MDRTERLYRIQQLLAGGAAVTRDAFLDRLRVSHATFKRDLEQLRERLKVPIVWDRAAGGYRIDTRDSSPGNYQLPGLGLDPAELHALIAMRQLLDSVEPGLLGGQAVALRSRIRRLIEAGDHSLEDIERRVRLVGTEPGDVQVPIFQTVLTAALHRRRVAIGHADPADDTAEESELSPQRLVHFRAHWYLDAWSHEQQALRSIPLDTAVSARLVDKPARRITMATLDAELGAGYGVTAGRKVETAVLRFTPQRARWAAFERWHPGQAGSYELDGGYVLQVPFSLPRELLARVLAYGAEVEVLAPAALRAAVRAELRKAAAKYAPGRGGRR